MIRCAGLFTAILPFLLALTGCGGSSPAGGGASATWRLEVAVLPLGEGSYVASSPTPGCAMRLRRGEPNGSGWTMGTLEEVDYSTGHVRRSVEVFDRAGSVSISKDGTQAYVFSMGILSGGEGRIQRVSMNSFSVSAVYTVPISTSSYISDLEINPANAKEIVVMTINSSTGHKVGPLCYRDDTLLPLFPANNAFSPGNLSYADSNSLWGSNGQAVSSQQTTYSVGSSGVSVVGNTNVPNLVNGDFVVLGSVVMGTNGLILRYPSLTIIRDLVADSGPYNMVTLRGIDNSQPAWFMGLLQRQQLDFVALSPSTWDSVAKKSVQFAADEDYYDALPIGDSSLLVQTSKRNLLVQLTKE